VIYFIFKRRKLMKKIIISTFALLLTLATIVPANAAKLGYQGENPVNTTVGTSGTSTGRYGYRGENPNAPRGYRNENQNSNWKNQHQGTRANQGSNRIINRSVGY
jgi:hypothetical protein